MSLNLKFIDLFCGIGGFHQALSNLGFDCVLASDIDKDCRDNYKENLKKLKYGKKHFKNRDTLSKFVYNLHEMINKNLGKESGLTYSAVRERYEHFRARCFTNKEEKPSKKEKGCTKPLHGVKSKCVLNIVPKSSKKKSLTIDKKCKLCKKE
jgi:hypothetical protein